MHDNRPFHSDRKRKPKLWLNSLSVELAGGWPGAKQRSCPLRAMAGPPEGPRWPIEEHVRLTTVGLPLVADSERDPPTTSSTSTGSRAKRKPI